MKIRLTSHQAHFFTDNADVNPTPKVISSLLNELGSFGLIPTFGNMLNAQTGEKKQFVNMVNSEQELNIEFPPDRIIVSKEGGDFDSFVDEVESYFSVIAKALPEKSGHRLSLLNTGVYEGETAEYEDLYNKLFTYNTVNPFEWDNRVATRDVLPCGEAINNISTVKRCAISTQKVAHGIPFDAVSCEVDVNTIPDNKKARFALSESMPIYRELQAKVQDNMRLLNRYFG